MKRSEMINKIDEFLVVKKGIHKAGSFDFANDILDFIEYEQGMAPPMNSNFHKEYGGDSQFFNSWSIDDEDEE